MTTDLRAVIDTTVLVSAAFSPLGKPRRAVDHIAAHGVMVLSQATFLELTATLYKPRLLRYLDEHQRRAFLEWMQARGEFVDVTTTITACRDPKDDMFLEAAVSGQADVIVSSDADLLVLHLFRSIPILNPADFLQSSFAG